MAFNPIDKLFRQGAQFHEQGKLREAEGVYREVLKADPRHADAMHHLGLIAHQVGQHGPGIELMRRSIELRPEQGFFHMNLASGLQAAGRFAEAVEAWRQAIQLAPKEAMAHHGLGVAYEKLYDYEAARAAYEKALELEPRHAPTHFNLAVIDDYHGRYDEAMRRLDRAIELKPDYALARTSRATDLLRRGEFERGWEEYEWRWKLRQFQPDLPEAGVPVWDGAALNGRTILLRCEQGLGDTIQFVRYAAVVKERSEGRVVLLSQPPLKRLMQSARGVDEVVAKGEPLPKFDVQAPLLSLPRILKTRMETIPAEVPYMSAEGERVEAWRAKVADASGLRVGLVWSSNPTHPLARFRTTTLGTFAPLAGIEGVTFYSLQKGEPAKQASSPPAGMRLIDLTEGLTDFAETAALMANLDMVITVDTAVAHLGGAMGKRTWTIVPFLADFRWFLGREESPWYPTMRLFRLKGMYEWPEAVGRVAEVLREEISGSGARA